MKKSDKRKVVQRHLSEKEEWTSIVPVLNGVAVSYAIEGQVEECLTGQKEEKPLPKYLLDEIISLSNLSASCRQVIRNKGSAGIDGMTVKELGKWFSSNWRVLQEELRLGTYEVQGVKEILIPKAKGGHRKLGIPTVKDRLVQQAIYQVLSKLYEPTFSPTSYGFRKGRGTKDALKQLSHYISKGKSHIVDIDMAKFFDEVNHERLLSRLRLRVKDKVLLSLIHKYLRSGILENGILSQRIKGTPQGSPLSPLLSNIVLDELDKELSKRGHTYVRYADDLIIVLGSKRAAVRVKRSIISYIEKTLRLKVNQEKSRICRPLDLNYLGHRLLNNGMLILSESSENRLKQKIRYLTQRNRGRSLEQVIKELNLMLRGWLNYFKRANMKSRLKYLDSWLRRRLRCYRLKQCKRAIGIVRFLSKLDVPKQRAWTTAASRKGWWRKSSTPASNEGMNNKWFDKKGLLNMSQYYLRVTA